MNDEPSEANAPGAARPPYDPRIAYTLLVSRREVLPRVARALSGIFGAAPGDVDVFNEDELTNRDWDAVVTCEYARLGGDLAWSLSVYADRSAAYQPPEEQVALSLSRTLGCATLFPGKGTVPSVWLVATADGRVAHVRIDEPEEEGGPWHVLETEKPVAEFPGARVTGFPDLIRESQPPAPAPDSPDARPAVPENAEHALEIARTKFGFRWPDGTEARFVVHEFDLGYIIYLARPPRQNPAAPPEDPGGSCYVIAKGTGLISVLPERPPESVITLYRPH